MGVRLRLSLHGFIFDSRRKGVCPTARAAIAKPSEPRKGRHHKARRVNAGNDGSQPKSLSPARGEIIKPGVSTPGLMDPHEGIPAPQGAKS